MPKLRKSDPLKKCFYFYQIYNDKEIGQFEMSSGSPVMDFKRYIADKYDVNDSQARIYLMI